VLYSVGLEVHDFLFFGDWNNCRFSMEDSELVLSKMASPSCVTIGDGVTRCDSDGWSCCRDLVIPLEVVVVVVVVVGVVCREVGCFFFDTAHTTRGDSLYPCHRSRLEIFGTVLSILGRSSLQTLNVDVEEFDACCTIYPHRPKRHVLVSVVEGNHYS